MTPVVISLLMASSLQPSSQAASGDSPMKAYWPSIPWLRTTWVKYFSPSVLVRCHLKRNQCIAIQYLEYIHAKVITLIRDLYVCKALVNHTLLKLCKERWSFLYLIFPAKMQRKTSECMSNISLLIQNSGWKNTLSGAPLHIT